MRISLKVYKKIHNERYLCTFDIFITENNSLKKRKINVFHILRKPNKVEHKRRTPDKT